MFIESPDLSAAKLGSNAWLALAVLIVEILVRREKRQGSIHRAVAASRRRGVDNRVDGRDHVSHHVASQDHLGVATRRGGVSRAGEEDVFETHGQTRADEKGAREVIGRTHRQ